MDKRCAVIEPGTRGHISPTAGHRRANAVGFVLHPAANRRAASQRVVHREETTINLQAFLDDVVKSWAEPATVLSESVLKNHLRNLAR